MDSATCSQLVTDTLINYYMQRVWIIDKDNRSWRSPEFWL